MKNITEYINEGLFSAFKISSQIAKAQDAINKYFKENPDKYKDIESIKRDLKKVSSEAYRKYVTDENAIDFGQWYPDFEKLYLNMLARTK